MLLRLDQAGRAAAQGLSEPGHRQRGAVAATERLKPAGERLPRSLVDLAEQRLLVAVDQKLQKHQHHREGKGGGGGVERRSEARHHAGDVVELRGREAGDGLGDADDRAEEAHDRNRPDHEPHQPVALGRP